MRETCKEYKNVWAKPYTDVENPTLKISFEGDENSFPVDGS